jgi:hypothetical protein
MSIKIAVIGGTGMGKMLGAGVLQTAHNLFGSASYFKLIVDKVDNIDNIDNIDKVDKVDNIEIIFLDRHHQYRLGSEAHFPFASSIEACAYMVPLPRPGHT